MNITFFNLFSYFMSQIKLDIEDKEKFGYDDSNALVLPSEKRSAKLKQETDGPTVKKLSKKERKRLQKIIEQKEKKNKASNRSIAC